MQTLLGFIDKDHSGSVDSEEFVRFLDEAAGDLLETPHAGGGHGTNAGGKPPGHDKAAIVDIHMSPNPTGGRDFNPEGWELVDGSGVKKMLYVWVSRVRTHDAAQRESKRACVVTTVWVAYIYTVG